MRETPRLSISRQGSALLDVSGLSAPQSSRGFGGARPRSSSRGATPRGPPPPGSRGGASQLLRLSARRSGRGGAARPSIPRLALSSVPEAGPEHHHPVSNSLVVKRPAAKAAAKPQRPRNVGSSGAKPGGPLTIRSAEAALRAKLALHYTSSRRLFRDLDDDKSGCVQPAEMRRFLSQKLHLRISPPAFASMMAGLDASGDGSVDLAEFLRVYGADVSGGADGQAGAVSTLLHERARTPAAYAQQQQQQQRRFSRSDVHLFSAAEADALLATKLAAKGSQLRKVFRQLDEDAGGSVGRAEIRAFMEDKFQMRMADGEFGKLMDLVDPSGDGSISFNEFLGRWGQAFHATEAGGAGHMLQGRRNSVQQRMDASGGGAALGVVSLRDARRLLHEKLGAHGTEARAVFRKLDEDKSGHISEAELRQIMAQKFNIATTDADFASLVAELDHDGSGDITIKEFLAAFGEAFGAADGAGGVTETLFTNVNENDAYLAGLAEVEEARAASRKGPTAAEADALFKEKMRTYHQQVRNAFRKVDRDNSQTVEKEEFALVLEGFAITMEAAEFDKLWRSYDHDGNGSINYDEFVANFSDEIQAQERGGIGVLMANSAEERREMGYVGKDYGAGTAGEVTAEAAALVDGELRRLVKRNWKRMKAMFVEADADRNGVLGRGEFRAVLKAMGMELGAAQFNRVWHKFDEDRGGAISYNEFLAACMVDEDQGGARSFRTSASRPGSSSSSSSRRRGGGGALASVRATPRPMTPALDLLMLRSMQRRGQLQSHKPAPFSGALTRAVAHAWKTMRKQLKQADADFSRDGRLRGRVPYAELVRVLGAHGADLRDPKDNVQVVAKLSDSRGDVAYNDFVKMCLQAPRA